MRLPNQAPAITRGVSIDPADGAINLSGCSVFKKIACAAALAACAAVCVGSAGTACVECLAGLGASGCVDCV
jgi:hypothetical protein